MLNRISRNTLMTLMTVMACAFSSLLAAGQGHRASKDFSIIEYPNGGVTEALISFPQNQYTNPLTGSKVPGDFAQIGSLFPFNNNFYSDTAGRNPNKPFPVNLPIAVAIGSSIGYDSGACILTRPAAPPSQDPLARIGSVYDCAWTNVISGEKNRIGSGSIMVAGPFYDFTTSRLAITGGTGAFIGAKGEVYVTPIYRDSYGVIVGGDNPANAADATATGIDFLQTSYRYFFHFTR
tara:strand:+ start:713 stop:1420 length:708 start_codon:yes stop_codon:yes gene_type:complete